MLNERRVTAIGLYLVRVVLLALAYYISGRLGLLLAVPPGYATAMWPPSGFALAGILLLGYRYWPGVLLGSFAVNLFTSFDPSDAQTMLRSGLIAAVIACGASLQAVCGAWLVRRYVAMPNALEHIRDIALLMICGGPLACLLNASIGVGTLAAFGAMPWASASFNWLTWWVGDTIGVLVFTPVLLLIGAGEQVSRRRRWIVGLALLSVFALTVAIFFAARDQEQERQRIEFDNRAGSVVTNLHAQLAQYLVILRDATAMLETSENVTRREFERFTKGISAQYPGLVGLSWSELVTDAERDSYEARTHAEGFPQFSIREFDGTGKLVRAGRRPEYVAVTFIAPYQEPVHGFDSLTTPSRRQALTRARDRDELVTTGRVRLVQANEHTFGTLIFSPVYRTELAPDASVAERRQQLRGFVVAAFYLPKILETSLSGIDTQGIEFIIEDDDAEPAERLLFESHPGAAALIRHHAQTGAQPWRRQLAIAARHWSIIAVLKPGIGGHSWSVWFVLAGGLLFTSLLGVFALLVTAQTDVVARLVDARTDQLQRSEERFRLVVEGAADYVIATLDPDGYISSWNGVAERIYGYRAAEIIGRSFTVLYPEPETAQEVLECAYREGFCSVEGWRLRRDGTRFWASVSITALYDKHGQLFGYSNIERDLTGRKQEEEQRARNFREVSELKAVLALANEAAGIGVFRQDLLAGTNFYDAQVHRLFGFAEGESSSGAANFLARVHPDDRQEFRDSIRPEVLAGKAYQWQYRVILPNGDVHYLNAATKGEFDTDGHLIAVVGATWDVTSLQLARLAAEQGARTKAQFLANMSHEIRTPLNGILGLTALVLDSPLSQKQRDYLTQVKESGVSLLQLLNDILDFSKMEAGKLELAPIAFDVRDVLGRGLQPLINSAREKGLAFALDVEPEVPVQISCDPHRLMQVVTNLVSNAIKFTTRGRIDVVVKAHSGDRGDELTISVRDTGIGVPAAAQEHIFDAFVQADTSTTRRFGGTGLGLSICRQIASLMGGRLWLHSQEGAGSEFHFAVPVDVVQGPLLLPAAPMVPVPATAARQLHILLAEDHPTNQNLATAVLQQRGHTVRLAATGSEALEWYQRERFDVILMDVQMPEMDGLEATAAIRALEQNTDQHVRIIALTAHVLSGDRERLLEAGMDDYLAKPFFPEQLLAAVERSTPAAPKPAAVTPRVCFNREQALARAMNNEVLLRRLVDTFLTSLPLIRAELHAAAAQRDADAIYRAAHKLKGSSATFAAPACAELAKDVETLARDSRLDTLDGILAELDIEIERLTAALSALREETP